MCNATLLKFFFSLFLFFTSFCFSFSIQDCNTQNKIWEKGILTNFSCLYYRFHSVFLFHLTDKTRFCLFWCLFPQLLKFVFFFFSSSSHWIVFYFCFWIGSNERDEIENKRRIGKDTFNSIQFFFFHFFRSHLHSFKFKLNCYWVEVLWIRHDETISNFVSFHMTHTKDSNRIPVYLFIIEHELLYSFFFFAHSQLVFIVTQVTQITSHITHHTLRTIAYLIRNFRIFILIWK